MNETIRIAIIYGSARQGRFCDKVVEWAAAEVAAHGGFTMDRIDPAVDLPASPDRGREPSLWQRIDQADAYLVVTPEYNHGYPAPLKSLIDSVGSEWHAKPVAFVSYGGVSGGLRAVEQLRQVFAELHTVTVRETVAFAAAWEQFDESGRLLHPERHKRAMTALLSRLHWWATALREARQATPFARAA